MDKLVRQRVRRFVFSFPIQLVVVQAKKNHFQLLYWLLLFCFVGELLMARNGVPYLFFDPEYAGRVNYFSFFLTGICLGVFIIAYNISSYLLNSHRFPFLASLSRTFFKYSLNNCIIPIAFIFFYMFKIAQFQYNAQSISVLHIILLQCSLLGGMILILSLSFWYFSLTDKSIYKIYGIGPASDDNDDMVAVSTLFTRKKIVEQMRLKKWIVYVEVYLASFSKIKLVRDTSHYDQEKLKFVLRKNHYNAAIFQSAVLVVFLSLGFLRDVDVFQIPAAASIFLLFTLFIMLSGLFSFWLGSWVTTMAIAILLFFNWVSGFEFVNQRNQLYGVNYDTAPVNYNLQLTDSLCDAKFVNDDIKSTISILENWKKKNTIDTASKPKLILLNVSGGGTRSMVFTFETLQRIDSVLNGQLMNNTMMIAGSSGGMISAAYYRQLFYNRTVVQKQPYPFINKNDKINVGKDLLNTTIFSLTVNDLFFSLQKFDDGKHKYIKDRAYAWERQLNKNTENVLKHRLKDYLMPEQNAQIPMLMLSSTIVNDGRVLYITPQPVSYLLQTGKAPGINTQILTNGIEFTKMFANHDALDLQFSSALRMNATFPYIMPPASLPSIPPMECMDSGIRDNFGLHTTCRFLQVFKKWISDNTSGVVIIQIRDTYKHAAFRDNSAKTLIQNLFAPLRNVSNNLIIMQEYNNDAYLQYVLDLYNHNINLVTFELPESELHVPLSWHLTSTEKTYIEQQTINKDNAQSLQYLQKVMLNK
ncbi:MAG: patatin-like phospholipase family protein [Bacteroidetes bacterium]|nr:patatin-like phospholipase family protein [Bacteroidota bacterium]